MNLVLRPDIDDGGTLRTVLGFLLIWILIGALGVGLQWVDERRCEQFSRDEGLPSRYERGINSECFVQVHGEWIPRARWKREE